MKKVWLILVVASSGCNFDNSNSENTTFIREEISSININPVSEVAYSFNDISGNRLVNGKVDLSQASVIDIVLNGTPRWVLSAKKNTASIWVAVLNDGSVQGFSFENGSATEITVVPNKIPSDIIPMLTIEESGDIVLGNIVEAETATLSTTSIIQISTGKRAYIRTNGDLVIVDNDKEQSIAINAMPNTRILVDENERLLLLTDYTTSYPQHVMQEFSTSKSIALIQTKSELKLIRKITIPANDVIEGNALIWTDMNNDQQREIITTISDPDVSSHIAVYDEYGNIIAKSESIGIALRWRHQIAIADFGLGQKEIASTLFPHLDNQIEFFRLDNNNLVRDYANLTYTSHRSSASQNIDMAIAADVDDDGVTELLIPSQDFNYLAAIEHPSNNSITETWQTPVSIGGYLTTNISAVQTDEGNLQIGVGNNNNKIRIWY